MAIVKQAAATGRRVKVRGSGHARNGMASTDGVMIVLDNYRRLLLVDRAHRRVTVQAGISLGRLSLALAGWGLALDDPAAVAGHSVGGAVSTGSPGRGAGSHGLAGAVTGLDLITADGTLLSCSPDQEPDIFDAARVGLGALGVISSVTLQCVAGFNLRSHTRFLPVEDLPERFDETVDGNDHAEFVWVPRTGLAMLTTRNRTDEPPGRCAMGHVDRAYRVLPAPRWLPEPAMEYSVPRPTAVAMLRRVFELVSARQRSGLSPVRIGVSAAERLPMSPSSGRPSALVAVGARAAPMVESLMDDVPGARPLWGTLHHQTAAALRPRYPEWDGWQALRRRLDPEGRFANCWTDRVLGQLDQTRGQG